jgi:voltage-gated sodium channel
MGEDDLKQLRAAPGASPARVAVAGFVESPRVQRVVVAAILVNALVLGLETSDALMAGWGGLLTGIDRLCLFLFVAELLAKLFAQRGGFFRSGWNCFDLFVIGIALVPGAGPWAVLRSLRVLRVLRLLSVVPSLRKVVAAFLHAIPGLGGVSALLGILLYTSAVLATNLFGDDYPEWFGGLGRSLFTLFQILTLEGWADMVRVIMKTHPWAPAFFLPFILTATFTALNLFIGVIVSAMQELAMAPERKAPAADKELLDRLEADLKTLRARLEGRSEP